MTTTRRPALLLCALIALLAAYVALHFEVATDITGFLPDDDRALAALSRRLADSELSRTHILTLTAPAPADCAAPDCPPDLDRALTAARALEAALRADPAIEPALLALDGGPPQGIDRALYETYHPHRFNFGPPGPLDDAALTTAAERLRQRLAEPLSPLLTRVAPSDPLLILPDLFDALAAPRDGVTLHDARFITADRRHAILFLTTHASAFDADTQAPLIAAIDRHIHRIDPGVTLQSSAIARYAVRAEAAIKADIQRVSTLSLAALALLLLALFRSLRLVLLTAIPLAAGVLAGAAATLALFGRIHGITLAFGASLIGVAIDYVIHLYAHHALHPHTTPHRTITALWPTLRTGAATTAIGFAALAATRLTALREVAAFSVAGITLALLTTRHLVPHLMPRAPTEVPLRRALLHHLTRLYRALRRHRRLLVLAPLTTLALTALAAPHITWNTDFARMQRLDPALVAEDHRVRARVARFEQNRFIVALGPDDPAALEANDRAAAHLRAAVAAGELAGYRTAAHLLPAESRQRAAAAAWQDPTLPARFDAIFTAHGFAPAAFAPFHRALAAPLPAPLTWPDLRATPIAPLLRPYRADLGHQIAWLTFLRDIHDPEALRARLAADPALHFVDQTTLMAEANRAYQRETLRLLLIGLTAVLLLLALRYRHPRRTLAAFLPALLGALTTVAALTLLGTPLDLIALTALLMVVSMGVDYGVFLVDAHRAGPADMPPALLSVTLASLSTLLGFGLLALSDHPVLHVIGATAGIGVLACLLLSPTALVLLTDD